MATGYGASLGLRKSDYRRVAANGRFPALAEIKSSLWP
jgi:hypothetical protein